MNKEDLGKLVLRAALFAPTLHATRAGLEQYVTSTPFFESVTDPKFIGQNLAITGIYLTVMYGILPTLKKK